MNTLTIAIEQSKTLWLLGLFEKVLARLERFRVKNHLQIVEKELLQANIEQLSPELKQERAKNIARLHEYWSKGLFPKNPDFLDRRVPYFKDHSGIPCAMAYLIEQSGQQNLVNFVASNNNHVYINDINNGPVLDWINKSGLTKAEAAKVQPNYGPCGFDRICDTFDERMAVYLQSSPIYNYLPLIMWILATITFILSEWLSYKFLFWMRLSLSKKKIVAICYFSLVNFISAFILSQVFIYSGNSLFIFVVVFVLLEWLSFKFSNWLTLSKSKRRILALIYFALFNLLFALILRTILELFFGWQSYRM